MRMNVKTFEDCLIDSNSRSVKRSLSSRRNVHHLAARGLTAPFKAKSPIQVTLRAILPVSQHLLLVASGDGRSPQPPFHISVSLRRSCEPFWTLSSPAFSYSICKVIFDGQIRGLSELMGLERLELESTKTLDALFVLLSGLFVILRHFSARWRGLSSAGQRGPAHDDLEVLQPTPRLLERFSRSITDHGRTVGWLEIYSHVTERRQIQSRMLQTEKLAALGKVVAGIAHELNNPLTGIMGNAQLLLARGHYIPPPFLKLDAFTRSLSALAASSKTFCTLLGKTGRSVPLST